jgi:hypothetical protein
MPVTYTNRKDKTYYLHEGTTKSGKPSYHFALSTGGNLVESIPDGFEVYESPNGQVYLRRIQRQIITSGELGAVNREMKRHPHLKAYKVDVKANVISIFEPNQDVDGISDLINALPGAKSTLGEGWLAKHLTYSAVMRFTLLNEADRTFTAERLRYTGPNDNWMEIGSPGTLARLLRATVKHLGRDSFFDLH